MYSLRRYDWTLQMATIAICAYFVARAASTYLAGALEAIPEGPRVTEKATAKAVQPSEEEGEEGGLEGYKVIVERNVFNSAASGAVKEIPPEEMNPEELGELGPATKTSLDIKLLGTLVIGEGTDRRSSATVSGGKGAKGGGADVYFPGDEKGFAPNVKLIKVAKDRIEFLNGGRLEFAELEDFAAKKSVFASAEEVHGKKEGLEKEKTDEGPRVATEGNRIVIDQGEVDNALQNLDKLMTEIRIVPNFKGGQPAGMKVLSVKPGSVLTKLGIKRGDILERVNGEILDMRQGMNLFGQMKDMKNFNLDVMRGGKSQTLEYEIR